MMVLSKLRMLHSLAMILLLLLLVACSDEHWNGLRLANANRGSHLLVLGLNNLLMRNETLRLWMLLVLNQLHAWV